MIGRHKFSSGVADSANTALVLASDWNADVLLGYVLTNRTGGTLDAGDVVAIDSANDNSVVLADTAGARRQYVVLVSAMPSSASHTPGTSVANLAQGIFAPVGAATVRVAGATTRGNYLRKSATTKALEDTGVAVGSAPPGDTVATALGSSGGAGSVPAIFRGLSVSPGGNIKSIQVFTSSGTWNRPAGIRRVFVEVIGAGGGGARTGAGNPGLYGGAAGGYAAKLIDVSSISSATVTVGSGGAGATVNGNPGSAGGNSSWSDGTNTLTSTGGAGGKLTDPAPAPGSGSGGTLNRDGSYPNRQGNNSVGGTGSSAPTGGGAGKGGVSAEAGGNGGAPGAGGGCGIDGNGGTGANGAVIVLEYE